MNPRPNSVPARSSGFMLGQVVIATLAAIALFAGVQVTQAHSESPGFVLAAAPTPTPVPTATPTTTPAPAPTPDPAHPMLTATVIASARFPCDRIGPEGACFVDVDDRGLTFEAEFTGARVLGSQSYREMGHAFWSLELPGTAIGIGPGGSVRAELTAGPEGVFSVVGADCYRIATPFQDEVRVPSTLLRNGVSIEFNVAPDEEDPGYACDFGFDPARLRRFPVPPTDTLTTANRTEWETGIALTLLAGLVAGALIFARPARRKVG